MTEVQEQSSTPDKLNETPEYLDALNQYYKLKSEYEEKNQNLLKDGLTRPKKDKLIKQYRKIKALNYEKKIKNCIVCGHKGGTSFFCKDRILVAKCNAQSPCTLDIRIFIGETVTESYRMEYWLEELNDLALKISKIKFNHLFGYESDDVMKAKFEPLKEEIKTAKDEYMDSIDEYVNIVRNPEILKNIEESKNSLKTNIIKLKDILHSKEEGYLNTLNEIYISQILPTINELHDLLNTTMTFEFLQKDKKKTNVDLTETINSIYSLKDLELCLGESPSVISFEL
jgi:hypothetical protein